MRQVKIYIPQCLFNHLQYVFTYSILLILRDIQLKEYLLELVKRKLKVHEKNMASKRTLNFDQWIFSKTISQEEFDFELFTKLPRIIVAHDYNFIQTQKVYPTSFGKISILTWRPFFIWSQSFSCELVP